jgi:uncharacterized protein YkwD
MTPTERDAAVLRDRIRDAEKAADSSDPTRRDAGLATLRGLGDPAKDALVRALSFQLSSTVTALYHLPVLRDPGTKASLYAELGKRRKAALDLIFDEKKYPYPHPEGPAYEKVQAEVVQLVDAVREVWETPVSLLADGNEDLRSDLDLAQKYASELTELGHPPDPSFEAVCATLNDSIGLKRYAPGGTEKSALEWNDDVLAYNRAVDIDAGPEERACVDALNDYRIMMGRRAVKWNAKLLEAARGHSKEMHDLKYFAHSCPFPGPEHDAHRNPSDRARQAGYGGGVSENIAMGSNTGKGAFLQWFGSSGHHRNMLGKGHTEVGVGRVDVYWTQNFGSASRTVNVPRGGRKQN